MRNRKTKERQKLKRHSKIPGSGPGQGDDLQDGVGEPGSPALAALIRPLRTLGALRA